MYSNIFLLGVVSYVVIWFFVNYPIEMLYLVITYISGVTADNMEKKMEDIDSREDMRESRLRKFYMKGSIILIGLLNMIMFYIGIYDPNKFVRAMSCGNLMHGLYNLRHFFK